MLLSQLLKAQCPEVNIQQIDCDSLCFSATITNGQPPFSYLWPNGSTAPSTCLVGFTDYQVTVTDGTGCQVTATFLLVDVTAASSDVLCNGENDGAILLNASGGTSPYNYDWDVDALDGSGNAFGLTAGTYTVTVIDANGCTVELSQTVNEPPMLSAVLDIVEVSCTGGSDGEICVSTIGGIPPYTYYWSNGTNNAACNINLPAGAYEVIVSDANGCTIQVNGSVNEPPPIEINLSSTNVPCFGDNSGTVSVVATGGTGLYIYTWNDPIGSSTPNVTGLNAGTYCATVTDANGCTSTGCTNVEEPSQLNGQTISSSAACNGDASGSATIIVNGGTPPFTYDWNDPNNQLTPTATDLIAGTYCVVVTDANGCTYEECVTVTEPDAISLSATVIPTSCWNTQDGSIDVDVIGGTLPYTFDWNDDNFDGQNNLNVPAGIYDVTVTDTNGCTETNSFIVDAPEPIILEVSITPPTCSNTDDGSIDLTATGGTLPYIYEWSNGFTTEDLTNISSGLIEVSVTDINNCFEVLEIIVNPTFDIDVETTPSLCDPTIAGGSASLLIDDQFMNLEIEWSNGVTNVRSQDDLPPGSYSVMVIDLDTGCEGMQDFDIEFADTCIVTIEGTVYQDLDLDCIVDPNSIPIPDIMVHLSDGQEVLTDGNGNYRFQAAPGDYTISVAPPSSPFSDLCTDDIQVSLPIALTSIDNQNFYYSRSDFTDLTLRIDSDNMDTGIYEERTFTITVENTGTEDATEVDIRFDLPTNSFAITGNGISASTGTYTWPYEVWRVGTVAAGSSEELVVTWFTLSADAIRLYAQVATMNEADIDSSPGNGICCDPVEDDEAVYILGTGGTTGSGSSCNINAVLIDLQCVEVGTPDDPSDDEFSFTFQVDGNSQAGTMWTTSINGVNRSGTYNEPITLDGFAISDGPLDLVFTDIDDSECQTNLTIVPPMPCSFIGGNGVDLQVDLQVNNPDPSLWENVTYLLTITNIGNADASNILVDFDFGAQLPNSIRPLAFVGQSVSDGIYNSWTGEWNINAISAGSEVTLELTLFTLAPAEPSTTLQASIQSLTEMDIDLGNNSDQVTITISNSIVPGATQSRQGLSSGKTSPNLIQVAPNPTSDRSTITIESPYESTVQLKLYNSFGQMLLIQPIPCVPGIQVEEIDLTPFPIGVYFLTIEDDMGLSQSMKILRN